MILAQLGSDGARQGLGARRGLSPPNGSLSPHLKHTGQESGGKLCEIFKCRWFLQSESVNNVCKLLPPKGTSVLDPLRDFRLPDTLGYIPQMKIPTQPLQLAEHFI